MTIKIDETVLAQLSTDPKHRGQVKLGLKLAEECGEVAREIKKLEAGKDRRLYLCDELGDVLSAMLKIAMLNGLTFEDIFEQAAAKRDLVP
jgi:NTP pyrophosphatase (non-canonical NTP hydrolase)